MANEDRLYLDWLHMQACQAPAHECSGPIVVHHPTHKRATGDGARKAHDHFGVTLCDFAHKALHDLSPNGPFAKAKRDDVRLFCDLAAERNRAGFLGAGGEFPDGAVPF